MASELRKHEQKPKVIILGGCGFVGRNLVSYLLSNNLVSAIRVIDKVPPQVAWLNSKHKEWFSHSLVEFKSANLINPESCEKAFLANDGFSAWDYVINCACETKSGQTDPVYEEGILNLSSNCAKSAAKYGVKHYVEISSGNMYSSDKVPHAEEGCLEPWTFIARWKSRVESELKHIPNLRFSVLRPAIVYGLGDRNGLTPRLIIGAVYKQLGETMKLLWNADLKLNTVHVDDLCKAIWHVCGREDTLSQIYNVVDDGNTTQGLISEIVSNLFQINHDYWGNALSTIVKGDLSSVVEEVNDKHLAPWAKACRNDGIDNTPLSPYMSEELLYNKNLYLDGRKLKSCGFTVSIPKLTKDNLSQIIRDYVEMKVFPKSLAP